MVPGSTPELVTRFARAEDVHAVLERILTSVPFRSSAQCQKLLTYIVRHTLSAEDNLLRERMVGVHVFARKPDYDAGTDPVVRVRVAEVRKRLAQFYQSNDFVPGMVRIEIPPGSYGAVFHQTGSEPIVESARPPEETPVSVRKSSWPRRVVIASLCVLALSVVALLHRTHQTAFEEFWSPALDNPKPILILNGHGVVYHFSERFRHAHSMGEAPDESFADYTVRFRKGEKIDSDDVIPILTQYLAIGDSYASAQFCALFARHDKLYQLRYGSDSSYGDLRYAPSVLIGAFNNGWTLETTREFRFNFAQHPSIRELGGQNRVWTLTHLSPDGHTAEDYAIVSRVFNSKTAQLLITAAGITQYGTRAAGEFLTTPGELENGLRAAPPDWQKKNIQFLLHTRIVGETPGPPEVVASYFW